MFLAGGTYAEELQFVVKFGEALSCADFAFQLRDRFCARQFGNRAAATADEKVAALTEDIWFCAGWCLWESHCLKSHQQVWQSRFRFHCGWA